MKHDVRYNCTGKKKVERKSEEKLGVALGKIYGMYEKKDNRQKIHRT